MENIPLHIKINALPDDLKSEVNDFVDFLMSKKMPQTSKKRKAGFLKGQIEISPDFNEPLSDFKEYM